MAGPVLCLLGLVWFIWTISPETAPARTYRTAAEQGVGVSEHSENWAIRHIQIQPCPFGRSIQKCLAIIRGKNNVIERGWDVTRLFTDQPSWYGVEYRLYMVDEGKDLVFEWFISSKDMKFAPLNDHTRDITGPPAPSLTKPP
jgi:hypothetical protein